MTLGQTKTSFFLQWKLVLYLGYKIKLAQNEQGNEKPCGISAYNLFACVQ